MANTKFNHQINKNKYTAELIGLSFGDGGLTERYGTNRLRFQLRGNINEDRLHYDNYIIPLFNKQIMLPIFHRKVGTVRSYNKGFYGLSVESKKLVSLNQIGIPIGPKNELIIPEWILNKRLFIKHFLRGFLDTDGSVHCQRNYSIKNNKLHTQIRISLVCCSKVLMLKIYYLLKKELNFKCGFRRDTKKTRDSYIVTLSGGFQVDKWFKIIGSKNPKHISKYKV